MITYGISFLSLFAGLVQGPAQTAATELSGEDGWQVLNEISLIVNEDCITAFDLHRGVRDQAQRRGLDPTDTQVLGALYRRELSEFATNMLQEQGGKALGFDPDIIDRITLREMERRRDVSEERGLPTLAASPREERDEVSSYIHARLHDEAVIGKSPGPEGRPSRDRYVRPGMLWLAWLSRGHGEHPIGNALREQTEVQMTQLILDYRRHGGDVQTRALAQDLRRRIIEGDEMGELAEEFGATAPGTRGLSELVPVIGLFADHREVYDFLLRAEIGDVSEPLPFRQNGEVVALVVVRLDELSESSFDDRTMQQKIRTGVREWLDQQRRGRALQDLLKAAYVWPREALGGPAAESR